MCTTLVALALGAGAHHNSEPQTLARVPQHSCDQISGQGCTNPRGEFAKHGQMASCWENVDALSDALHFLVTKHLKIVHAPIPERHVARTIAIVDGMYGGHDGGGNHLYHWSETGERGAPTTFHLELREFLRVVDLETRPPQALLKRHGWYITAMSRQTAMGISH